MGVQHIPVVYSIPDNGYIEMRFEGETGTGLLYIALGIAAKSSFLASRPVMVLENGLPFRIVNVMTPRSIRG